MKYKLALAATLALTSLANAVSVTGNANIDTSNDSLTGVGSETPAVPEPSTTALFGIGGIALILRRRK